MVSEMKKILDHLIWLFVGISLAAVAVNHWMLVRHNNEMLQRLETFRSVGPRFTANNGQDLCESTREIQRHVGLPMRDCTFGASE
jgi:heme exporter protein D